MDNPIVELNNMPRARAPEDVVHKVSRCRALTRHSGTRYRRGQIQARETVGEPHCTVGTSKLSYI
jgi:hypothetical protein